MKLFLLASLLVLTAPAAAQDIPTPAGDDAPAFPRELLRLPEDVQQAAQSGLDADTAEAPAEMTAGQQAWYRAQIAYLSRDWVLARRYAETAAVAGETDAALLAGLLARDGVAGGTDIAAAVRWFSRAAQRDHPFALYQLGLLAGLEDDTLGLGSPRVWFERAARAGHVGGMVAYAIELRASPIPQDAVEARRWAERAALQGSAEGMFQLAQLLDAAGALIWYERAAAAELAEAAFQAGMMRAAGEGGPADEAGARDWLRRAAESDYAPAQGQYGLMLYQGRGGEADPELAAHWFSRGARGGDAESQFLYAYVLARGEGVPQDFEAAYRWVLEAATDFTGAPVHDADRDRLEAGLEQVLDPAVQARIRAGMPTQR